MLIRIFTDIKKIQYIEQIYNAGSGSQLATL